MINFAAGTVTSTANPVPMKTDLELTSKLVQLMENQLKIWKDFAQLSSKSPDLIAKIQENFVKKMKIGN